MAWVQEMSWTVTLGALLSYLLLAAFLVCSQLDSVGQSSRHAEPLAIARMLLNYSAVLTGVGNFKSKSMRLLGQAFGWTQTVQASVPLGVWLVDCAMEWNFEHRYLWRMLLTPLMLPLLWPIVAWRQR